jgi:hypothetical protein
MKKVDDLRWIRVFTPDHVPHYLIDQVRERDYSVEEFFKYHQINCMTQGEKGVVLNPFSHLYVLADKENRVQGMLWFTVDPLSKDILIQTYSMDKEYWGKGLAVKKLAEHIKQIRKKGNLNKIYWVTNYPKHSERYGFKRSKSILMEYTEENHGKNNDGVNPKRGEHRPADSRPAELPIECVGRPEQPASGTSIQPVPAAV